MTVPAGAQTHATAGKSEELLPFTVRLVSNEDELNQAVHVRHMAYARHLPDFAETLKTPEAADHEEGVVILLAQSKLDGSPLGTLRSQTNQFKPLSLEHSVDLPDWLQSRRLAEATRLGVSAGTAGSLVTSVLFKAFYLYCLQVDVEWMVVTGRAPVDRTYDRMLFDDVFPGRGYIPFEHVGNLPHRVLSFNVKTGASLWAAAKHPLYEFMVNTHHPDIDLSEPRQSQTAHFDRSTHTPSQTLFAM
jgi:hypothetical protein